MNLIRRPRRTRSNKQIRSLVKENCVTVADFILPLFVSDEKKNRAIPSMPDIFCYSPEGVLKICEEAAALDISAIALFPSVDKKKKDKKASYACREDNFYLKTIAKIKQHYPNLLVIADVAMDPYNSDGQDGLLGENQEILNDETLEILSQMALLQAAAGADIIAPSDMMDGRIGYIRKRLDTHGYENTILMSYTAKYASSFYAPFRDALDSAPGFGDKKSYQMDPANIKEAQLEAQLDFEEGADIIMVKPGIFYLDVVRTLYNQLSIPIAAYNVSGEYAMIKAAAQNGWVDYNQAIQEIMLSFKRAGCSMILTYHALDLARLLQKENIKPSKKLHEWLTLASSSASLILGKNLLKCFIKSYSLICCLLDSTALEEASVSHS